REELPRGGQIVDRVARTRHERGPCVVEALRDAATDALGGSSDQHDLAGEIDGQCHGGERSQRPVSKSYASSDEPLRSTRWGSLRPPMTMASRRSSSIARRSTR